jgi:regulator of sigma E protease
VSVIIFILILAVLIVVHELGHFFMARKGGIRVDEFGLGYPPRARTLWRKNGTDFTLNWLPFGGFVKIFGENPDDESVNGVHKSVAFVNKPKWVQALVLFAGPFMNFFFAWLIILATLFVGLPTTISPDMDQRFVTENSIIITNISPDSPASRAGLKPGDTVLEIEVKDVVYTKISSAELRALVLANPEETFNITTDSPENNISVIKPADVSGEKLLGLGLSEFGIYKPNFGTAFIESFRFTGAMIANITLTLVNLIGGAFTGTADVSNLAGPIGIVGLVGDASEMGLVYLMTFTALISINLGVINLIPFPALDGGRLLFLLIEKIKGGRINYKVANTLNFVGFSLLIILMLFISYKDIVRLF